MNRKRKQPTTSVTTEETASTEKSAQGEDATEQTITYLGEDYVLPAKVNNIVAASLESMEDRRF